MGFRLPFIHSKRQLEWTKRLIMVNTFNHFETFPTQLLNLHFWTDLLGALMHTLRWKEVCYELFFGSFKTHMCKANMEHMLFCCESSQRELLALRCCCFLHFQLLHSVKRAGQDVSLCSVCVLAAERFAWDNTDDRQSINDWTSLSFFFLFVCFQEWL